MPAPAVVTLYRRDGCPLCDEVEERLRRLALRLGFEIEALDIEADDDLLRRYVFEIPVVAFEGNDLAKAPIYGAALEALLEEALARRQNT